MPLESAADRRALIAIDEVAVRIHPGGVPIDGLFAQYDGPSEEIDGVGNEIEVVQTSASLLMVSTDVAGLAHLDRVEVLEGPGLGDYVASRVAKEDDGAFTRISLAER